MGCEELEQTMVVELSSVRHLSIFRHDRFDTFTQFAPTFGAAIS
jgi:hypothetical protein